MLGFTGSGLSPNYFICTELAHPALCFIITQLAEFLQTFFRGGPVILESPFDIDQTADEPDSLISLIKSFDEETRVVMEDTGHYHLPVATYLFFHNIFVCCVNALRIKKFCSQSIRRAKTDKIDSIKIASFGITYWSELTRAYDSPDTYD